MRQVWIILKDTIGLIWETTLDYFWRQDEFVKFGGKFLSFWEPSLENTERKVWIIKGVKMDHYILGDID